MKLVKLKRLTILLAILLYLLVVALLAVAVFSGEDRISNTRGLFSVGYSTGIGLLLSLLLGGVIILFGYIRHIIEKRKYNS